MAKKLKIENNKKHTKWNIFKLASQEIENAFVLGTRIELFHNSQAIIEGCLGVYEYSENYLKIRLSSGALVLCGADFNIVSFEEKTIVVNGKITSLEFCV